MADNALRCVYYYTRLPAYRLHQALWRQFGHHGKGRNFHHDYKPVDDQSALVTVRARVGLFPDQEERVDLHYPVGETLGFSLSAAAMTRTGNNSEIPCADPSRWLLSRAENYGFRVQGGLDIATLPISVDKGAHRFWLLRAEYNGTLVVTDAQRFSSALEFGIGRHRGLGFGMLSVRSD